MRKVLRLSLLFYFELTAYFYLCELRVSLSRIIKNIKRYKI